jgi:hypothetical protein
MDAICIDQSTTQEKSHQVGMMGQIYARSAHVFACVGPHTKDSTFLFKMIDENRSLLARIHGLTLGPTVENTRNWVVPNPIPKSSRVTLRCLFVINPRRRYDLAAAFIDFMKRSYFSRVWVLQELHLAPRISLCCGMDVRSFDSLLAVSMLVDFWTNISNYKDSLRRNISFVVNMFSWQSWFLRRQESCLAFQEHLQNIQPQRGCLTLASGVRERRRLAEVLEAMQSFQCTDVRDRLFGILALVEWGRGEPAVPDYGKDNYQVAIEVLRLYLENSATEPVSGMAAEWPRRLWEIFNVEIEGQAMQEATAKRYDGYKRLRDFPHGLTETISYWRDGGYFGNRDLDLQNVPTRPPRFGGHPRDTWYGVRLLNVAGGGTPLLRRPPYYLHCKVNHPNSSLDVNCRVMEIMDQDNCSFAYAHEDTKPGDWLLISEASSLGHEDPTMVIVASTYDIHGTYRIVGQASKNRKYKTKLFAHLQWEYFGSRWAAEDLFLFDWTYICRSLSSQPTKSSSDCFSQVCDHRDSSVFYGPIGLHDFANYHKRDRMKYNRLPTPRQKSLWQSPNSE